MAGDMFQRKETFYWQKNELILLVKALITEFMSMNTSAWLLFSNLSKYYESVFVGTSSTADYTDLFFCVTSFKSVENSSLW